MASQPIYCRTSRLLRERFVPDLASLPQVSVHLTPLTVYEALNDSYIGEAA